MRARPGWIARLKEHVRRTADRLRDERELATMGPRELSDIGASRADLEILIHAPADAPKRLEAMLRRLRIDPAGLAAKHWLRLDLEWTCALCGERPACRAWLASRSRTGFERFCPNAERLRALKSGRGD